MKFQKTRNTLLTRQRKKQRFCKVKNQVEALSVKESVPTDQQMNKDRIDVRIKDNQMNKDNQDRMIDHHRIDQDNQDRMIEDSQDRIDQDNQDRRIEEIGQEKMVYLGMKRAKELHGYTLCPLILHAILPSIIKDQGGMLKEIDRMASEKIIKRFEFVSGLRAYMFREDYIACCKRGFQEYSEMVSECRFTEFLELCLEEKLPFMLERNLLKHFSQDELIVFMRIGCIYPQEGKYLLGVPYQGTFLSMLMDGRKELLSYIKRQKFQQIELTRLFQYNIKKSRLKFEFHLRELKVMNDIRIFDTNGTKLVKLVKGATTPVWLL